MCVCACTCVYIYIKKYHQHEHRSCIHYIFCTKNGWQNTTKKGVFLYWFWAFHDAKMALRNLLINETSCAIFSISKKWLILNLTFHLNLVLSLQFLQAEKPRICFQIIFLLLEYPLTRGEMRQGHIFTLEEEKTFPFKKKTNKKSAR